MLKAFVQRLVNRFGYKIEKLRQPIDAPIEVFDLLMYKLTREVPDFFFVQIGANDGVTHDPIREYVLQHHWRGLLVEPQPQVFQRLLHNYRDEKQLRFEEAAIADQDGPVKFFVADGPAATSNNLTVFSSLKKDILARCLPPAEASASAAARMKEINVPALSVQGLLAKHHITKIDLLQIDTQGYDCEIVRQFLAFSVRPTVIHFEHYHTGVDDLHACYQSLAAGGYRLSTMEIDTVAYRQGPLAG
jgi:FkbM family methyltransferase